MTKVYLFVSLVLFVAALFGTMIFSNSDQQLTAVSWNSGTSLTWTAGQEWGP